MGGKTLVKNTLVLGIIALFIVSAVSPMVIGYKTDAIENINIVEKEQQDAIEVSDDAPDTPSQPSGNTSGYICIDYNYSTSTTDPGGLNISYGWDWDGDLIVDEWTDWYESNETCTIDHNWSEPDEYNISVKAKNTIGGLSNWSAPLNVTMQNHPPFEPICSNPEDGAINVPINVTLCWTGGDPDSCDTVIYNVYLGTSPSPPYYATVGPYPATQTEIVYEPGPLEPCTRYYWKIVAFDNHGLSTEGPICTFTIPCPPDAPIIDGPTSGKVGVDYQYNFSLFDLDGDSMYLRIDWGNGTSGPWHGPYDSDTTVKLNHTWNQKGAYTIRARAKDTYNLWGPWSELEVTMPKNQNLWYIGWLERFPILHRLLDALEAIIGSSCLG